MKKLNLFRKGTTQRIPLCLYIMLIVFIAKLPMAYPLDTPKAIEESIMIEKKIAKEREKAMVEHFYKEGKRFLDEEDYDGAVDRFSRILEIDPEHRGAKSGIRRIRRKLKAERKKAGRRVESPELMARRLLKNGKIKYGKKDYDGAIEDFQDALVLDYTNEDILEWLKRARYRRSLEEIEGEEKDLAREAEVATRKKEAHEKTAMLEVESAYLPPEKPERKPIEVEELISPEEERAEKARQELLKRLQEKMVPAVSLAEADIRDVIRQLMEITGVTIVIDEGALAQAVGKEPLRLTFTTVTPLPLMEVLDIALRATELAYKIEPNYIWISTPAKLEKENLVTKTYRLRYGVRRIRKVELKEFETTKAESE